MFLVTGTASSHGPWFAALVQRLRELDWNEGRTIAIEYRWAEGRADRFAEIAAELVRLKVDVIVSTGSAAREVIHATSVIPVVFALWGDPIGSGYITSLARPGGNATGLSMQSTDIAGKRLELLGEVIPGLRRLAILGNFGNPNHVLEMDAIQAADRTLGLEVAPSDVRRAEDIAPAFEALKDRAGAVHICNDPLFLSNRVRINTSALGARLPTMYGFREHVEARGLISYGANFPDLFRRAGAYVDKILRGAKPGDIPVSSRQNSISSSISLPPRRSA